MGVIGGYHAGKDVAWRRNPTPEEVIVLENKRLIGLEFEHEARTAADLDKLTDELDVLNRNLDDPIQRERDGSIDRERGVEFIFPPVPYRSFFSSKSVCNKLFEIINRHNPVLPQRNACGMHVNLNVQGLSEKKIGAIVAAFHMMRGLGILVAGRENAQYAKYQSYGSFGDYMKCNKYNAAWYRHRSPVIEVRIMRADADWDITKKRVRYCTAVMDFAVEHTSEVELAVRERDENMLTSSFLKWLKKQPSTGAKGLYTYIKEKKSGLSSSVHGIFA